MASLTADVMIGTLVQVYNLISRQWQPGVVQGLLGAKKLSGGALWGVFKE
jgi:hypothetical protein